MAKNKKGPTPFPPWATTNPSGTEKRYVRFGNTQMLHPAMKGLSHTAFRVYMYMRLDAGAEQGFVFPRSRYKDWLSHDAFDRAVVQLVAAGLIEVYENNKHRQRPNVYRFSEAWKAAKADK